MKRAQRSPKMTEKLNIMISDYCIWDTMHTNNLSKEQFINIASMLMMKFRQPSYEFTIGVGMNFISYPLVLTPLV
jgi:hypothetical protein